MLDIIPSQPSTIQDDSIPGNTQLLSSKPSSQTNPLFSPYWTPIALYYLEREAEWARG